MKKRILVFLGAFTAVSVCTGVYLVYSIKTTTSRLDNLIRLHRVAILRENFMLRLKRVQSDLILRETRHSRSFDTMVRDIMNMGSVSDSCLRCHHEEQVMSRIRELHLGIESYKDALSRVLTIRANTERLAAEEDTAYRAGEALIDDLGEMLASTNQRLEARTASALSEIERTKYILYFLVLFGPVASTVLAFLLIRNLADPVSRLVRATRQLKGGDLDHRVQGLRDEFAELEASFNEMAQSLRDQMGRMQRAEQLSAVGELAAGLAHEIKNPLAGIKVAMNVLLDSRLEAEDREVVEQVGIEVTRLESLMRSFLRFARPPKPEMSPVRVNDLLDTTLTFIRKRRPSAGRPGNPVEVERDYRPLPETMADPMQIQQVCLNLFLNALDAMPDGGTLRVATRHEGDPGMIRVDISDSGNGIEREFREKIFEPFFTTKGKGTGLGLAISRQLLFLHGGTVDLCDGPAAGATFTLRLPVVPPPGEGMP
ncbi:MAG TPA: ATP-binding protein [Candidatus Deferrimicrobiaceae bacterium]